MAVGLNRQSSRANLCTARGLPVRVTGAQIQIFRMHFALAKCRASPRFLSGTEEINTVYGRSRDEMFARTRANADPRHQCKVLLSQLYQKIQLEHETSKTKYIDMLLQFPPVLGW